MSERDPVDPGTPPDPAAPGTEAPPPAAPSAAIDATAATDAAAVGAAATGAAAAGGAPTPTGAPPPAPPTGPTVTTGSTGGGGNQTMLLVGAIVVLVAIVAALLFFNQNNGTGSATAEPSASGAAEVSPSASEEPSEEPSETPSEAPTPSPTPDACAPENLALLAAGQLTAGTDNPAFPPYFAIREGGNTPPWEDLGYTGDPTTGEGFESAVAYAVADKLGFAADDVTWVVVPFANAIAPGNKPYDFVINQVSYSVERAQAVDLSDGYYDLNQAVVALVDNPAASATSLADLKPYKFGAQVGTTSYTAIQEVIQPDQETQVYNDNTAAIAALVAKQIDAIVVDLPTADFIANAGVEIESGLSTVVGQFAGLTGEPEHFSLALPKDSALTPCVNQALEGLRTDGTLKSLASTWLPFQDGVPVLQ